MARQNKDQNYLHGIYYTPVPLANILVANINSSAVTSAFDPSFGSGVLLKAAFLRFQENNQDISITGCDIFPEYNLLPEKFHKNLYEVDFFEYNPENKFDLIITNPPYVKHQIRRTDLGINDDILDIYNLGFKIPKQSDLWVYFLLKSCLHLNKNGSIAAILPWSFLQAEYSIPVRKYLSLNFKQIKVLGIKNKLFHPAEERIVLIWLENNSDIDSSLKFSYTTNEADKNINYRRLSKEEWLSSKVGIIQEKLLTQVKNILKKNSKFKKLSEVGFVRSGIVTGANKFFIKKSQEWDSLKITNEHLKKIVTSSNELTSVLANNSNEIKELVTLDTSIAEHKEYIDLGVKDGINLLSHPASRTPWYIPVSQSIPDAFFPYRIKEIPFLALNTQSLVSTNSVHRIYFPNLSLREKKWIFVSMLSIFSQIKMIEISKSYGRELLKIEPGTMKEIPVVISQNKNINKIYNTIVKLICQGQKKEAVLMATQAIIEETEISKKDYSKSYSVYELMTGIIINHEAKRT